MTAKIINTEDRRVPAAIPEPDFTPTWKPYGHGTIINVMDSAVASAGLEVVHENYTIARKGHCVFGTWQIAGGNGRSMMLGFRNSTNKAFALGITGGAHITVCSNMMFSGEFLEFRKHTSGLDLAELAELAAGAVYKLIPKIKEFEKWHEGLHDHCIINREKAIVYDLIDKGAVSAGQFNNLRIAHEEEKAIIPAGNFHEKKYGSLYTIHGAVTRVNRGGNLFRQEESNRILNGICDDYMTKAA